MCDTYWYICDKKTYAKAYEIMWNHEDKSQSCNGTKCKMNLRLWDKLGMSDMKFFINASHYATDIQMSDAGWYGALTSQLTAEQQQELNDVVVLADQRKAAAGMSGGK